MLKDFLSKGNCFKLICGAGNEDVQETEKLIAVYSYAGCRFFDISANVNVLKTAKKILSQNGSKSGYICVSVGTKDDVHVTKAFINPKKCKKCGKCFDVCGRNAVRKNENSYSIEQTKCIGCQKCINECSFDAIQKVPFQKDFDELLTKEILSDADCIELHVSGQNEEEIFSKWDFLTEHFDGFLSICINRSYLGDKQIISLLKKLLADRKPYTTIIQADGNPMSGGRDDYNTTLQAVAAAELIQKENLPVYLFSSGGTNTLTFKLAKMCNVNLCGVAMGSYARLAVKEYIKNDGLLSDESMFKDAGNAARRIINSVLNLT